jgi:Flp pilus assembly protein TadD
LAAARRAAELGPDYPPNVLALAEALAKTGDTQGAVNTYRRARDVIQALPPSRDRDDWQHEADQALRKVSAPH